MLLLALLLFGLASAAICSALGYGIAEQKCAGGSGALLGALLGPFGVLIACFLDERPLCPRCGGRIMPGVAVCPHCRGQFRSPLLQRQSSKDVAINAQVIE